MVKKQPIWVPKKKIRHTKYLKRKNQVAKEEAEEVVAKEEAEAKVVTKQKQEVAEDKLFFYSFYYHCFIF